MQRFDLLAMIRRARPVLARMHRRMTIREITPSTTYTGDLDRLYNKPIRLWWERARDRLLPSYTKALDETEDEGTATTPAILAGIIFSISAEVDTLIAELEPQVENWGVVYERWHRGRWVANLKPGGVDLGTLLGPQDVEMTLGTALQQNVSLIRGLSDATRRRVEQVIFDGFQRRISPREIARTLSEQIGMERKRALRIASHQTVMLSSDLDTERMRQAGITEFEWRHSGKLHYRPHHKARDGQVFKLDGEIDPDDMPGIPIWCGCKKRAVLPL